MDPSVDTWRTVSFPVLRSLIDIADADDLQLKVMQRGCAPLVRLTLAFPIVVPLQNRRYWVCAHLLSVSTNLQRMYKDFLSSNHLALARAEYLYTEAVPHVYSNG